MKIITLLCACMGYLNIANAMEPPGQDGPSKDFILPGRRQKLPSYLVIPQVGAAMGGTSEFFIPRGSKVEIRFPGIPALLGTLEHGNAPVWLQKADQPATKYGEVFIHMPAPHKASFYATFKGGESLAREDPKSLNFEVVILTGPNHGFKSELNSESKGAALLPSVYVRLPESKHHYVGALNYFG